MDPAEAENDNDGGQRQEQAETQPPNDYFLHYGHQFRERYGGGSARLRYA